MVQYSNKLLLKFLTQFNEKSFIWMSCNETFFFCRLEKWLKAIPNPPPSPQRKNARICSCHFFKEDFKVYSTFKKSLKDDAVPKAGLCYLPADPTVSNTSSSGQSYIRNSPLGVSILSPLFPSPHINKETLHRNYGKLEQSLSPRVFKLYQLWLGC